MKFGNFNRCKRINDLITYKLKKIKEFNVKYEKYKKKLPNNIKNLETFYY